jgi:hypothetical protein
MLTPFLSDRQAATPSGPLRLARSLTGVAEAAPQEGRAVDEFAGNRDWRWTQSPCESTR